MDKFIILQQKAFESHAKFEKRLNETSYTGYEPISMSHKGGLLAILLKKRS